jgi:DNA-binding transcriptional LysR family regulator
MIETKQLRIFRTVVEVGSFTAAGTHLRMSQPAISQQIRALEAQLGVALIVRAGRGARPTPAGEALLPYARLVLDKIAEAAVRLAEYGACHAGVVRIRTSESASTYVLPPVLAELKGRWPRLDVQVTSGHRAGTLAGLAAGDVDLALLPLPADADRFRVVEVGSDELVAVVPTAHRWAGRAVVHPAEFEGEPLVVYDRTSEITDVTSRTLFEAGVFPRPAIEIDQLEAVKEMVRSAVGVAVMPRWAVWREVAAGALAVVRIGDGIRRVWGVLYPDERASILRPIVDLLREMIPGRLAPA